MKKRALIVGNGVSNITFVADFLLSRGYQTAIINPNRGETEQIASNISVPAFCGDGTIPEILKETNMQNADIAIIMYLRDEDNFLAAVLCKRVLKIKRVVSVLNDPNKLNDFYRSQIDSVVCETTSITSTIDQRDLLDGMATLIPISGGRVNILEVTICETAPVVGKKLWEIELPSDVIVGCVLRKEQSIVPRGDTRILSGDTLILIALDKQEVTAVHRLTGLDLKK
jgi:trk system potassium uptake protein TrkA